MPLFSFSRTGYNETSHRNEEESVSEKKVLEQILTLAEEKGASDIHLSPEEIWFRRSGKLYPASHRTNLSEEAIAELLEEAGGRRDLAISLAGELRVRVHLYRSGGKDCAALRLLPAQIPDARSVDLPQALKEASLANAGLVIIAGPTGSGKSTTLAAMIRHLCLKRQSCVITLEDPVEYDFSTLPESRCMIRQRNMGEDFESYEEGIRDAMREDPDIIMLGELRDRACAEEVLKAAETGHLVLTTLHTASCEQSVNRFLELFPPDGRDSARGILADVLLCVCVQRLVPAVGNSRVAVREVMTNTSAVKSLIREEKTHQIASMIQTGSDQGMQVFDAQLARLVVQGKVSERDAAHYAISPRDLDRYLTKYH